MLGALLGYLQKPFFTVKPLDADEVAELRIDGGLNVPIIEMRNLPWIMMNGHMMTLIDVARRSPKFSSSQTWTKYVVIEGIGNLDQLHKNKIKSGGAVNLDQIEYFYDVVKRMSRQTGLTIAQDGRKIFPWMQQHQQMVRNPPEMTSLIVYLRNRQAKASYPLIKPFPITMHTIERTLLNPRDKRKRFGLHIDAPPQLIGSLKAFFGNPEGCCPLEIGPEWTPTQLHLDMNGLNFMLERLGQ